MSTEAELIFNPSAGGGTGRDLLPQLIDCFGAIGITVLRETSAPGDEETLAREALARNVRTLIAVGGDGTCSRIANAIVSSRSPCRLAVVPAGTGNDFAKSLGVGTLSVAAIAQLVQRGDSTRIDVGRVDGHYFLNSCGFGFAASVLEASKEVRFLKGDAVYIYAALAQLLTYKGSEVVIDDVATRSDDNMLMVTISNGRSLGGSFRIAPQASVVDGKLDVCLIRDARVLQRIRIFAAALRGTHGALPSVQTLTTRNLSLTFTASPAMEIDGELRHARSATVKIECIPHALAVIAAPGASL